MSRDAPQVLTELLVLQAQGGSERAFTKLHGLWAPHLRRFATVRVDDAGAADEVVQDAWIAIARGLRRLDDPACFPRWAFRILARRCADWVRQRQTERQRTAALETELSSATIAEPPREKADDISALRETIARLDRENRELLQLFYERGFSVVEIADVLDVPPGTVKSRLHTLREKLKQQLEGRRT